MKTKKIIITAWMLEVKGYSIWIEAQKWIKIFNDMGFRIELIHGRNPKYSFLNRENKTLLNLQTKLFNKKISYSQFIKNVAFLDVYQKTYDLFERKWQKEKYILVAENTFGPALNIPYTKALFDVINKNKIPTIARIHDFYVNFYTKHDAQIKDSLPELKKIFQAQSNYIEKVFINKSDLQQARKRKMKNIYLIPNGFDFNTKIKIRQPIIEKLKKRINLQASEVIFLQPTRIITRKRIEDLIYIISELKKRTKWNFKLLIAGGFKEYNPEAIHYQDKIISLLKKNQIPLFILKDLGILFEIQEAYYLADFITLLSQEEGFGLPVLESCAYKKMLIVRRFPRFSVFENLREGNFQFIETKNQTHPWQWKKQELTNFCQKIIDWQTQNNKEKTKILQKNYQLAKTNFSLDLSKIELKKVLDGAQNINL